MGELSRVDRGGAEGPGAGVVTGQVEEGASWHQVLWEAGDACGRCREPQTNLLPERPLRRAGLKPGGFPPHPFPGPPIAEHANR